MNAPVTALRPNGGRAPLTALQPDRRAAEEAVRTLLRCAGHDRRPGGLIDTPARVARAFEEFFAGYAADPAAILGRTFKETDGYDEMVLLRGVAFESHCEQHHMVPIIGTAHVAYIPHELVVGISKLARVVIRSRAVCRYRNG